MAQRRNHYGDGFHAGNAGGYSGYDTGYSQPQQHAFPSYSPKSLGIKGNKGRSGLSGAASFLAVALVVTVIAMLYLFMRGNTLSTKIETLEADAKSLRKKLSKAEMDYKSADKLRMYNEQKVLQLDKLEANLREQRMTSAGLERKVKELTEALEAEKGRTAELQEKLNQTQAEHGEKDDDIKALKGQNERMRRTDAFWKAKEEEWLQSKKILELDLELAKANIDRLETQMNKERETVKVDEREARRAARRAERRSGESFSAAGETEPQEPMDPEFKSDDANGQKSANVNAPAAKPEIASPDGIAAAAQAGELKSIEKKEAEVEKAEAVVELPEDGEVTE